MTVYKCITHGVRLQIESDRRIFENPPGSYAGMPRCELHLMPKPKKGKFGDCEIVKEKES